ncbi:MAG: hypothetical protein SCALA702_32540 [Melioribacteraceae bacterium]|nr:MAG: hypothetical protein SCALA702_32540 [Melioribacteraceae bacterium]
MGRKKQKIDRDEIAERTEFCTECGEELTHFHLSGKSLDEVKSNFERCKEDGKFKGDKCSKLYIIDDEIEFTDDDQ